MVRMSSALVFRALPFLLVACSGGDLESSFDGPVADQAGLDVSFDGVSPSDVVFETDGDHGDSLAGEAGTDGRGDLPSMDGSADVVDAGRVTDANPDTAPTGPIYVRTFGAIPNDGQDDSVAIRAAVAAAIARGADVEVVFESGAYRLSSDANRHLFVDQATGLTLRGVKGATRLVMTDPMAHGIFVDHSARVTLSGFVIDYEPLPYTQGTIVAVNSQNGSFELALDAGYPRFSHPVFDASAPGGVWGIVVVDKKAYELYPVFPTGTPSAWPEVRPGVFRLVASGGAAQLTQARVRVGARYVSLARGGGIYANALNAWRVKTFRISGVTVWSSPGAALLLGQTENVTVDDYHVAFPPQGNRLLTTDADGIHSFGNRGGLEIQASSFTGMGDDSINIHARAATIAEVRSARELKIANAGTVAPRAGEQIAVYAPDSGAYRGQAVLTKVEADGPYMDWLTLDRDVPGVVANAANPAVADWFFNLDACGKGALIHHNTFGRHRGRAMVLRAPRVSVYENQIENDQGLAVALLLNGAWREGPIPAEITVRDNTFTGVSIADSPWPSPAIATAIYLRSGGYAATQGIADVKIQNNVFEGLKGMTMRVSNARNFQVLGNWTNNTRQNKVVSSPSILFAPGVSAFLNAYGVSDQNPQTYAGIHIQKGATVTYQGLTMSLAAGIPWVQDDN